MWDTATGRQLATFRDHRAAITQVSFNDTGDRLLAISKDMHASLWDVHLERRTPAEIDAIAKRSAWVLVGGLLVAANKGDEP
jgi:WD40 repeat protein